MKSLATTAIQYLNELPTERRGIISSVRQLILKNLPPGYQETMQYGMITYIIPLSLYPNGYLGDKKTGLPYISLGSQKNYCVLHLMGVYAEGGEQFKKDYLATGKKLDMGKGCVRFKTLDDLPLDLISKTVASASVSKFVEKYEAIRKK